MTLSCRTGLGQLALVQSSPGVGVQRVRGQIGPSPWGPTLLATLVAGGVGYLAVAWFLRYIAQHRFTGFVIYRVLLGATLLVLVGAGTLPAHR
mgnify:CR=1 FL=1